MDFVRKFVFFIVLIIGSLGKENFSIDKYIASIDFNYVDSAIQKYNNNDIVGRLVVESLNIDTPIVQANNNKYYLDYDIYKNENLEGSIFLDYRNVIDIDRKLLIYGHNSKTLDTLFNRLEMYLSFSFYNDLNNRLIKIETENKEMIYEVCSVLIVNEDFQHMKLSFEEDEWTDHVDWINDKSIYDDKLLNSDDILIMQTCCYNPDGSFLLIVSKKINEKYF